jgi:hypothetical protein
MKLNTETREATGNIDELVNHYVRRAGWFDDLQSNMKARIEELGDCDISTDLINQLKLVNAWWDESMEDTSRQHSHETCFHLRQSGYGKLGR